MARVTPEDDVERLAERIWNEYGNEIEDIDSFNKYFNKYMGTMNEKQESKLRKSVFKKVSEEHKSVVEERLHPKAGRTPKEAGILEDKRKKREYTHLRYVKNKVVYASEETLTYKLKTKKITRIIYRDRFGRFTSIKSLRERKGKKIHKIV